MAWRSGSLSRSLISAARTCSPTLPRARPPPLSAPRLTSRRLSFLTPRSVSELGCVQSLLPLYASPRLASHLVVDARAFCELSQGRSRKDG
uniref:Uncharacterized protein n=1 Tax=Kalanchoe fedtschenkoi TaxID=63787 RepID=A0A7N0T143_KALFE